MATTLPRITARVDVETQELLTKAAAIAGMSSINSFVLSAAIEKAKQVIDVEKENIFYKPSFLDGNSQVIPITILPKVRENIL